MDDPPSQTPSRYAFAGVAIAATAVLLTFAVPVRADVVDTVSAIPATATGSATPAEPVTAAPGAVAEPVTTVVAEPVSTALAEPEAAPSSESAATVATDTVDAAVDSVSAAVESAPPSQTHVSTPSTSDLVDAVRTPPIDLTLTQARFRAVTDPITRQVPELIRQIPERSVEVVRSIVEQPLASIGAEVTRPPPPLGRVTPISLEKSQPPVERFRGIDWGPSGEETTSPLDPPAGLFGDIDRDAPLGPSAPIPESPGSAAPGLGSSGSFFVPIAALLALLALVAPATFRRLREVPNLPAPTPFVCALERPG
jgi:hypothetical protein